MHRETALLAKPAGRSFGLLLSALFVGTLIWGCDPDAEVSGQTEGTPIASAANAAHELVVEFYGELVGADSEPPQQMTVDRILVRDEKTGQAEPFVPADPTSLASSFGYFTDVWSPDEAYLALPLGRFQGFVLFSADKLLPGLRDRQSADRVQIRLARDASPALWHEFIGWEAPHTLRFAAGLSGDLVEFEFDPKTRLVRSKSPNAGSFVAITAEGQRNVRRQPD